MAQPVHYFDYAAASPLDPKVIEAMMPYFSDEFYNPSSPYAPAVEVRRAYHAAKQRLARTIGATADELVMTAGATESINLAIGGFGGHKITGAAEHASVRKAIQTGEHTILSVDRHGIITAAQIADSVRDDTEVVSVALANHEIGSLQPIREIAKVIEQRRRERRARGDKRPLVLHCDASQGFGLVDIHVGRLGVDLLTLNAGKIYGPKQVGLLWVRPGVIVAPRIVGGGQESGLRSGTENVAGVIGFAEAAYIASEKRTHESKRLSILRDSLERALIQRFPNAVVSGHPRHRLVNFCHISFPGIDAERLVFLLEMDNVLVATGSACAANSGTRSSVLEAIGLDNRTADGSLRLTLGRGTTAEMVEYAATKIIAAVEKEASRQGTTL
jgi:cysteine desulfurase